MLDLSEIVFFVPEKKHAQVLKDTGPRFSTADLSHTVIEFYMMSGSA